MREKYGSRVEDLRAAVGPSIGACCYAVGDEVRAAFGERFGYAEELFREVDGAMHVDLWEANRRQLLDAGLQEGQIAVVGECTACARDERGERRYFSHRAERGVARDGGRDRGAGNRDNAGGVWVAGGGFTGSRGAFDRGLLLCRGGRGAAGVWGAV